MINAAVIGVGGIGREHVRVYHDLKQTNLVAISDIKEDVVNRVSKTYGCHGYTDYKEMLEREDIEAVSICVPSSLHYRVSKDVIEHECNLLVEKPLCLDAKEADDLVNLAERKKVFLTVGHIERFNPIVQKLKQVCTKLIGNIFTLDAKRVGLTPPRELDSNVILDLSVHDIDVMRYITGSEIEEVFSFSKAVSTKFEDCVFILLKFDNDILGSIETNWVTPTKIRKVMVTGEKGAIDMDYISQEMIFYEKQTPEITKSFDEFVIKFESITKKISVRKQEPLKVELNHFLNCIKNVEKPVITGKDGAVAIRVAQAAVESNETKKIVRL
jgi:UDP-N-acetylglucosamine 3-dehydrogenase